MARILSPVDKALLLGYDTHRNVKDTMGRTWRYCVSPFNGGPIAYFKTRDDFDKWTNDVNEVRGMYSDKLTLIDYMQK